MSELSDRIYERFADTLLSKSRPAGMASPPRIGPRTRLAWTESAEKEIESLQRERDHLRNGLSIINRGDEPKAREIAQAWLRNQEGGGGD